MGEAMKRLGVCRKTLRAYISQGKVRALRLPDGPNGGKGHWRIPADSLESMLTDSDAQALALARKHGLR